MNQTGKLGHSSTYRCLCLENLPATGLVRAPAAPSTSRKRVFRASFLSFQRLPYLAERGVRLYGIHAEMRPFRLITLLADIPEEIYNNRLFQAKRKRSRQEYSCRKVAADVGDFYEI
jgi:hypothetical protein